MSYGPTALPPTPRCRVAHRPSKHAIELIHGRTMVKPLPPELRCPNVLTDSAAGYMPSCPSPTTPDHPSAPLQEHSSCGDRAHGGIDRRRPPPDWRTRLLFLGVLLQNKIVAGCN
uniref:Uncharacterized protein n=1 Tax=Triticum urartu TaxID=4572 RepID=A0A8R7R1M8_TRIUA